MPICDFTYQFYLSGFLMGMDFHWRRLDISIHVVSKLAQLTHDWLKVGSNVEGCSEILKILIDKVTLAIVSISILSCPHVHLKLLNLIFHQIISQIPFTFFRKFCII